MRKIISAILAASMILSLCACSGDSTSGVSGDNTSSAPSEQQKPLSNPVALDANGDIDMKVALSYETDFDALLKDLESREPDGSKPVSKNTNPETLALFNYLKENYGVKYDSDKYVVNYSYFGANIRPTVIVTPKMED